MDVSSHVETVTLLSQRKPDDVIEVDIDLDERNLTAAEKKATYAEIQIWIEQEYGFKVSTLYIAQIKRKYGIEIRDHYNISQKDDQVIPQCLPEKEDAIKEALKHYRML